MAAEYLSLKSGHLTVAPPRKPPTYGTYPASKVRSFYDDFFYRVYVSLSEIAFGEIVRNTTSHQVDIWNAYPTRSVTLQDVDARAADGLIVDGPSAPLRLLPLALTSYRVSAKGNEGSPLLNSAIFWVFDIPWSSRTVVTGFRGGTCDLQPSWPPTGKNYQITYSFKTEMLTSHSGKEQRIALRTSPRKSLEHRVLLQHDTLRSFQSLMRHGQHRVMLIPELTKFVHSVAAQAAQSDNVEMDVIPDWLAPGAALWSHHQGVAEIRVVYKIENNTVWFRTGATAASPAGLRFHPALTGHVFSELSAPRATNAIARLKFKFDVLPLSELVAPVRPPARTFNGRELFLKRPNWARQVAMKIGRDVHDVDFGRGPTARFTPVGFGYETYQASYLGRNAEEVEEIVNLFRRMRGQQGEFYMPSWENEIIPEGIVAAQSRGLTVKGQGFAQTYENSTVYRAVFVMLGDGSLIFRKVIGVTAVEDGSLLQIDQSWGETFTADSIVMCGWMPVRRLASDNLVVEWVSNTVAQVTLNMVTLEDLPPETA